CETANFYYYAMDYW
nr:immunoglobulin heavy chain junction region [Mus musculus]